MSNASVFDVAKYILEQSGEITALKLQKLVFYSKAWSLVWDEDELFGDRIEAWANGAVIPELFKVHRGKFKIGPALLTQGNSDKLTENQRDTIRKVLGFYGKYSANELSDLNHTEAPWLNARGPLPPLAKCTNKITNGDIFEYYSGIRESEEV